MFKRRHSLAEYIFKLLFWAEWSEAGDEEARAGNAAASASATVHRLERRDGGAADHRTRQLHRTVDKLRGVVCGLLGAGGDSIVLAGHQRMLQLLNMRIPIAINYGS